MTDYSIEKFLADINLPASVGAVVCREYPNIDFKKYAKFINGLLSKENSAENFTALSSVIDEDKNHFKMLIIQLEAARRCRAFFSIAVTTSI